MTRDTKGETYLHHTAQHMYRHQTEHMHLTEYMYLQDIRGTSSLLYSENGGWDVDPTEPQRPAATSAQRPSMGCDYMDLGMYSEEAAYCRRRLM